MRVECIWHKEKFEYVGLSPKFKRLKGGEKRPQYSIEITEDEGCISSVEAVPVDVKLVTGVDVEVRSWVEDSDT